MNWEKSNGRQQHIRRLGNQLLRDVRGAAANGSHRVMDQVGGKGNPTASGLKGVEAIEIVEDQSELPKLFMPSHPEADANGYVTMPNVHLAMEMVNLMTASRAYEANVKAAQTFRQLGEQALAILRS
jgi:flagellar basal-body rod protein FlgC